MQMIKFSAILVIVFGSLTLFAKGDGLMRHGGVGFNFEDVNSFSNPSHRGHTKGAAFQLDYTHINNASAQSLTPSFVWGSGSFGIGMFASRLGTSVTDPNNSVDSIGGDIGGSFANDRFGFGASYVRSIDTAQISDGVMTGAVRVSGQRGMGINASVAGSTTVNRATRDIKTGTLGLGYGFTSGGIEAVYCVTDFQDPKNNNTATAALSLDGRTLYFGASFGYTKPVNASVAQGRLGLKYKQVDFSVHANQIMQSGNTPSYGGTFRLRL